MRLHRLRRACFASLLLAAFSAARPQSGSQSQTKDAGEAFRAGLSAVQTHDLTTAEREFTRVVKLAPGIAAGHSALGAVLVQEGKWEQAVAELRAALRIDPQDASAQLNLGSAVEMVIDLHGTSSPERKQLAQQAVQALLDWQAHQGTTLPPDAAIALARLQIATGNGDAGLQTLQSAAQSSPHNAAILDAFGVLLAQRRQFPEAIVQFQNALAAMPANAADRAPIEVRLGSAMLESGDAAGAAALLQETLRLHPANILARVQFGTALFSSGQQAEGLAQLREAVQRDPANVAARYQLALSLESAGHVEEALPLFAEVRKSRPNDPELLTNMGLALVQTGNAKEAVPLYLEGLKLDGNNATLHQDLGVAYLQQSDLDDAIAEFRKGLTLQPDSAQLAYDLGLALKLKDNLPEAIVAFEKARSLDPTLEDAPYTLGVLYMQQGQFTDAAKSLRTALQLNTENADVWAMLGSVLKQDGKPQEAAEALRKAITLDPGQPGNYVNLASVLVELGEKEEAVKLRKVAADLSRAATTKQRERFALDSGNLLKQRGQFAEAVVQFRNAVAADPNDPAAHTALADALAQTGAKAEAETERAKAKALAAK